MKLPDDSEPKAPVLVVQPPNHYIIIYFHKLSVKSKLWLRKVLKTPTERSYSLLLSNHAIRKLIEKNILTLEIKTFAPLLSSIEGNKATYTMFSM